jgi:RNA-directed DNA polymerase
VCSEATSVGPTRKGRSLKDEAKPFCISRWEVWEAYLKVKSNQGAAGLDAQTIEEFERDLKKNLYRIWNRMSSGSYFPPPVLTVKIPKANGGERTLGIPTVSDRVAQMVVKNRLEAVVDPLFLPASYGYRPKKSALDAVGQARQMCWAYDWICDLDIKGFFDNLDHDLMMRAVQKHAKDRWMELYIGRWLKAPAQDEEGRLLKRERGTPQGGVMTPRTQKVTLSLIGACLFCGNRVRIDLCRIQLYVYDRCRAQARSKRPNASIVRATCSGKTINFPTLSVNWRWTAPCRRVRPIATCNRRSG